MLHSQGLSNNPYPEPTQFLVLLPIYLTCILILSSHLCLTNHFQCLAVLVELAMMVFIFWFIGLEIAEMLV